MDYAEEQESEKEALSAIYGDDFTFEGNTYRLSIASQDAETGDETARICLVLTIPKTYPESVPEISVEPVDGINESRSQVIAASLIEEASSSEGMVVGFALASKAQDILTEFVDAAAVEKKEAEEEAEEEEDVIFEEDEEAEQRKQDEILLREGTPVTEQGFLEWQKNFLEEKNAAAGVVVDSSNRLSGRQMFEQDASLATSDVIDGATDVDSAMVG